MATLTARRTSHRLSRRERRRLAAIRAKKAAAAKAAAQKAAAQKAAAKRAAAAKAAAAKAAAEKAAAEKAAAEKAAAEKAARFAPRPYTATPVPSAYELHLLKRLGCGYSRRDLAQIQSAGGAESWLAAQLDPDSVPEAPIVADIDTWFADLTGDTPAQKVTKNDQNVRGGWLYGLDLGNWSTLRRIYTNRPVLETMVDFWSNHLHISTSEDRVYAHQHDYHLMLRRHALGKFSDLLLAASTHPAMSLYLDNWRSVRNKPNENQGRELLELHTVGIGAGYTEDMVKASARLLSGYTVRQNGARDGFYDPNLHTTGPCTVLGFTHPNTSADGRAAAEAYLDYLAHHPATAQTFARRLATRFVSDTPSQRLVDHLAQVFTDTDTDIKATLLALIADPEFRGSAGKKVTTPVDDLVATVRALDITATAPSSTSSSSFAYALQYVHGGLRLYSWVAPDGAPETNSEWSSAVRMTRSWRMHWNFAGGYWPSQDAVYPSFASRMPHPSMSFGQLFDHLSRTLLGKPSTSRSLQAACTALDLSADSTVLRARDTSDWKFPHVASILLDSPDHMTR